MTRHSVVFPLDCISLTANNISVQVGEMIALSVRLAPDRPWWQLWFVWEVSLCLLFSLICLAPALLAEWRWRWLRARHQPTAGLLRCLAIFYWLSAGRNAGAAVLLRTSVLSQPYQIALLVLACCLVLATDLAFAVFLILFAKRTQMERYTYTKESWRQRFFILTQVAPLAVLSTLTLVILVPAVLTTAGSIGILGPLLGVGVLLGMIPSIVLAFQLSRLVRYTMRVLPFRRTKLFAAWLLLSGLCFGAEHTAGVYFVAHYPSSRAWTGFLLPLALILLPAVSTGWLLLLWPPLGHSVSVLMPDAKPLLTQQDQKLGD